MSESTERLGPDTGTVYPQDRHQEFAAALIEMQADLPTVPKDSTNPHYNSKYAGLPTIWETIRPVLKKHGFAVIQNIVIAQRDGHLAMETQLVYKNGVIQTSTTEMPMEKSTPQGYGSAVTYLRRYALGAMLGIVTDEDDDANVAEGKPASPTISEGQIKRFWAISKKAGYDSGDIARMLKGTKVADLSPQQYKDVTEWIEKNPKQKEANGQAQ